MRGESGAHAPSTDPTRDPDAVREAVRDRYAVIARAKTSCCSGGCGCAPDGGTGAVTLADYSSAELAELPPDADLGLGCGNPLALESLSPGETVVDLGSGGGIDCFLAARKVGPEGRVIGIDMTAEMVLLARRNAARGGFTNVEFRLGEIEDLPLPDETADIVISNCVINLVPDKRRAFAEAFRVLKPGGRLSVSDIVTDGPLPEGLRESVTAYVACLGGALPRDEYLDVITAAGFQDVRVVADTRYCASAEEAERFVDALGLAPGDLTRAETLAAAQSFHGITVQGIKR